MRYQSKEWSPEIPETMELFRCRTVFQTVGDGLEIRPTAEQVDQLRYSAYPLAKQGFPPARKGFTFVEITAALAILGVVMVLVAQVAAWILQEKARLTDYESAQELAANVLEQARARPWSDLTPEWAKRQRLPDPYLERGWTLAVRVAPEEARPRAKRVTATVTWKTGSKPAQSLEVMGLFADRSTDAKGEKP